MTVGGSRVVITVWQLVWFSSSPLGQCIVPSHNWVVATHVPSLQANWSGAQVTATHKAHDMWSLIQTMQDSFGQKCIQLTADTVLYKFDVGDETANAVLWFVPLLGHTASSVPDGQSLSPSQTLSAGTHLSPGHWNSPGPHTHLKPAKIFR